MATIYVPPTVEEDPREDTSELKGKGPLEGDAEASTAWDWATAGDPVMEKEKNGPSTANKRPKKPSSNPHDEDGGPVRMDMILFKDAVGRKFKFPFDMVRTWTDMAGLIKQAFIHVDIIGPHVQEGHYDLIDPEGMIILPQLWSRLVQPDWVIEMRMWPMDKAPARMPPAGIPYRRPRIPPGPGPPGGPLPPSAFSGPTRKLQSQSERPPLPPPPPGWVPPESNWESINVASPPKRKTKPRGSMLSWMSGKPIKAPTSKQNKLAEPHSPPVSSPPSAYEPNLAIIPQERPRRSTLANEMKIDQSLPRSFADRSLNLRPKKKHAKVKRSGSPSSSSSSSSTSSSDSHVATVISDRTHSSTGSITVEEARELILQRGLLVTCAVSSKPLPRPTTIINAIKTVNTPSDVLELSAARIYRDGFEKTTLTTLELVKQRPVHGPPSQERYATGASTMTWRADEATRSSVEQLFVSISKKKVDDEWYIKPGTVLRCDTRPGEKVPASVTFISVPYLYADSFKSNRKKYQGDGICLPRRLHEAFSLLGSVEQDKKQHFYQNEGRNQGQVLWVGQIWILVSDSSLLTYGVVPREVLQGDSIAIREQRPNDAREDSVIQIVDEERRLFYLPADKCRSFYELETSARDKLIQLEPNSSLDNCDLSFSLPNGEPLNASRWSSVLKLEDVPVLKLALNFYSGEDSDAESIMSANSSKLYKSSNTRGGSAKSDIPSLDLDDSTKGPQHSVDISASKENKRYGPSWRNSRQKFVEFTIVEDVVPSLSDNTPKLNSRVPPFFDWKPKARGVNASTPAARFRERLDEVEGDLLQLYKFHHSNTNLLIEQVYHAFGSNIYEGAPNGTFGDFSHRRRSQVKDLGLPSSPRTSRAKLSALAEGFFSVSVPALEVFVVSEFNSSLMMKYFGALSKVMTDPTSSQLLHKADDDIEPHESTPADDESTRKLVVSRDLIKQADLRFVLSHGTDEAKCPDCERGMIYSTPEKGVEHLRKMHLIRSKTDRVLRDYLVPLPAALSERLNEELCELLVTSRNTLASTLRKLVAIQSGVMDDDKFRGSERGIPYYLVDAFKLIVIFVCALPEALHELRWFYNDFNHNTQNLTSQKFQSQRTVLDRLGEVMGDLIRKAERTLVSPTGLAKENNAEHFMTSVGLNYLSLQIMFNLFQRPVYNRKKVSDLFTAYAKNLGSEIQRKPNKRQIPQIGALSSELNLLKDVVELQQEYVQSFNALILPETLHPPLPKDTARIILFGIESQLIKELSRAVNREDQNLDGILELCVDMKGLVSELTEIMADDQGRAVFVFTVVTVTFLPLSFVASYLSMSGGTDGLGMEWGDVQARFWMVAGPLTVAVAAFCFLIAGRGTVGRLLSRPTQRVPEEDDIGSEGYASVRSGGRRWWPRWSFGDRRRVSHSITTGSSSSRSAIVDD
ncbi:hypothetical protein CNYM01_02940 [Colletotrichum nymphaeae SA-01]|uniref:Ubiquitin-like domain-containing protein n=1 Tax=Colletotrichum nymphaeae SA-01 TaxID=1460502 RepID=A0A135S3R8_9PEZI|nr:hypothetical protein CNYM01_02940 [Colletotrichum nymphaeae SA-01]